jgi:two-component system, response regulator YesN
MAARIGISARVSRKDPAGERNHLPSGLKKLTCGGGMVKKRLSEIVSLHKRDDDGGSGAMFYQILVVDDDKDFREMLRDALEGYEVVEAASGAEALEILRRPNDIDVVLLDVMMPGMRGTDVLREMKAIAPDVGIVISTGFSSKDVAVEALKGHADDYVEKPLDIPTLEGVLARVIGAREPALTALDLKGKVARVKQFAERNVEKKVSLEDAAAQVSLSPKYLSRIFKQETGTGFAEYRADLKMHWAKELLATTGYNVNQIAEKLAYENAESFIRAFKKSESVTPSEYRRRTRNEG